MNAIPLKNKVKLKTLQADFVVVGGGMAGVSAALAAARNGLRVVLIQDRSMLGGNASSEVKMHIVGADCHGGKRGLRESGLIEELRLEDAMRNPHRSYSQWDLLLYEKVTLEPNITLLLDTACIGCTVEGKEIRSVTALKNSTEEQFEITAMFFADCSGDSRLGYEAGADYTVGRESKAEYGESLAQEKADRWTLGSSILITGREHATPQPFRAPSWIRKFTKADFKHRPIHSYEYGYWWFEWGGQLDTIADNEPIRHELLRIALGVWDYVKNSGDHPAAANWALDWVGSIPAKRESRRLLGPHILTQHDVLGGRLFADAVAYGGWAIDIHPPQGVDVPDEPPYTPTHLDKIYTIPFGSLYSRNIPNLLFAGRNISATHVAFASTRVMATCSVMGQAIGTAAALAVEQGVTLAELNREERVKSLQQRLIKDDAYLPNLRNEAVLQLTKQGDVKASSSREGFGADLVLDGVSRDLIGSFGPWADGKPHHWESTELPAWLELRFDEPKEVSEIHLTFDSGILQRELMLTPSDHHTKQGIRGPQPELIKSYEILVDGKVIATETDNYLRKRVHRLESPIKVKTLRIVAKETHGATSARLFEIAVY